MIPTLLLFSLDFLSLKKYGNKQENLFFWRLEGQENSRIRIRIH